MDKQFDQARTGYQQVLTDFPDNAEAKAGLTGIDSSYRYQLDLLTGYVNSDQGSSVGGGADLLASLNATDSLELGFYHNDKELPAPELAQQTLLPSNDFRVGYISRVPQNYDWSISYDYRDHSGLATEHWLQGGVGGYVLDGVQLFAGLRDSFGAPQWDGQLADAGVISSVADGWEVVGTGYFSSYAVQVPGGKWHGHDTDYAFSADLNRQGPGNTFFNIGVGYSPDLDNFDVHGRAVIPVIAGNALLFSIDHVSINNETQATIGWRFFLQ
jgi:hypothetical protein